MILQLSSKKPKKGYKLVKWNFGKEIEIPENWKEDKLRYGLEFLTDYEANGSFEKLRINVKVDEGEKYAWYVRGTDLENNRYGIVSGNRYCNKKTYDWLKKTRLHGGELLITKRGEIGKVYFMPETKIRTTLGPNLYLILLNEKLIPKFAYYWFKSVLGNKEITRINDSSVQGAVYKEPIKNCLVLYPPSPEQRKIVAILSNLDDYINKNKEIVGMMRKNATKIEKNKDLESLKKGLMEKLVTGQIRIKG